MGLDNNVIVLLCAVWLAITTGAIALRFLGAARVASRLTPSDADRCTSLVDDFLATGRHIEALVVAKKFATALPANSHAQVLLARVLATRGQTRRSTAIIEAVLARDPTCSAALDLAAHMNGYVAARFHSRMRVIGSIWMLFPALLALAAVLVTVIFKLFATACP
jgi:hypothetical protein